MPSHVPASFFFFTGVADAQRKRWSEEILVEHKIYFRHRDQLNDPDELRPTARSSASDAEVREFVRERILSRFPGNLPPAKRLQMENEAIRQYRDDSIEKMLHEITDKVGVLSLTESVDNDLLWSHYADGHRGIAIEFDASAGLFGGAQKVRYVSTAPVVDRIRDDPAGMLRKTALTKAKQWSYEREWRVIARWADADRQQIYINQHPLQAGVRQFMLDQHGPGHYEIPPAAVKRVILGARADEETSKWVESIWIARAAVASPFEIGRAVRHQGRVEVEPEKTPVVRL